MRTLSKTVKCPVCAQPASLVLFDDGLGDGDAERPVPTGQRFEFRCSNRRHRLDDSARSELWAA